MATTIDYSQFIADNMNTTDRGMNFIVYKDGGAEMYISFKALLRFISENLNLVCNDKDIVAIDWESDKPFYALSCHISTDLTKCYLYNENLNTEDGANPYDGFVNFHPFYYFSDSNFNEINDALKPTNISADASINQYAYPQIGNISYIYLNTGYLSKVISENLDKENKITLRLFLQTVCDDVNRALGGINDFQVVVDADTTPNTLTIVDINQNRIKGLVKKFNPNNQYTLIKAQGIGELDQSNGSFVYSISAQSQITPELASAISIGAQSNGNQLGEEATSFSRLSTGLTDRLYPEKLTKNSPSPSLPFEDKFQTNLEAFQNLVTNLQNNNNPASAQINLKMTDEDNNGPIVADLFKALVGEFTERKESNPAFIPIKLDLELLGISGIKIFQQFELSDDVLPLSYKKDFNFLITGISHEVTPHKWVTKLASLTYLKEKDATDEEKSGYKPIKVLGINFTKPDDNLLGIPNGCKPKFYIKNTNSNWNKRPYSLSADQVKLSKEALDETWKGLPTDSANIGKATITVESGLCARGTWNLANNLKNYWNNRNNKSLNSSGDTRIRKKGDLISGKGNARDNTYSANLLKLGYTKTTIGEGLTTAEIKEAINSIEYNVGDILVYHAEKRYNTSSKEGPSAWQYGHTQMYVGDKTPSKWTTDVRYNYNGSFIYNYITDMCWTLYLYRVPKFV